MDEFRFDHEKNTRLKMFRGINFDDVVALIRMGHAYEIVDHPNQKLYPHQRVIEIEINGYYYKIPAVKEAQDRYFLKTIYADRKLTRKKKRRG